VNTLNNTEQTVQFSDISISTVQDIMDKARAERARVMREFFKTLGRRQVLPVWNESFKLLFPRFSH
jgi:hypothetical protein